jgi:hypothetical protein
VSTDCFQDLSTKVEFFWVWAGVGKLFESYILVLFPLFDIIPESPHGPADYVAHWGPLTEKPPEPFCEEIDVYGSLERLVMHLDQKKPKSNESFVLHSKKSAKTKCQFKKRLEGKKSQIQSQKTLF